MEKDLKSRQRILQYAQEQFATVGYSKVSLAQFAADLKMSKSTFYKHFASKEELLFAVIDDFYDAFEREVRGIVQDERNDVVGKMRTFLLLVRKRFGRLHVSVVEDVRRAVPEAYARIEERRKRVITGTLVGLFEQGAEDGLFRSDIPPIVVANVLLQAVQHVEHPDVADGMPYPFADLFHQVFSIVMEGSLSERGRARFRD